MARLNWSAEDKDEHGHVEFRDPRTDNVVRTFPTAIVYFPSGSRVCGRETTVAQRRK